MATIIGITGRAGAGKDTVATAMLSACPPDRIKTFRFADPLKNACTVMFGWTPEQIEDRVFKETIDPRYGFTPRLAMQRLGTEFGRALNDDLWVIITLERVKAFLEKCPDGVAIISDVRFDNEASAILNAGGSVIEVRRPGESHTTETAHASEAGVSPDLITDHLLNSGTIEQLSAAAGRALNILSR